jgi:hypothetical protein
MPASGVTLLQLYKVPAKAPTTEAIVVSDNWWPM